MTANFKIISDRTILAQSFPVDFPATPGDQPPPTPAPPHKPKGIQLTGENWPTGNSQS